ncbi:MAG: TRAP transporter large permease subunit [Burkholderiaceae bacterium]
MIAVGVPIALSMAIVATLGAIWLGDWDQAAYILSNLPFESVSGESMVVLPLFIFMGVFAAYSGLSAQTWCASACSSPFPA